MEIWIKWPKLHQRHYQIYILERMSLNFDHNFADVSSPGTCHPWPNALRWRYNGHDGVSDHQPRDSLLNRLFSPRSKKTSKLRVTVLCARNSPVISEFPAQMASNAEMFPFDDVIMIIPFAGLIVPTHFVLWLILGLPWHYNGNGAIRFAHMCHLGNESNTQWRIYARPGQTKMS